MFNIYMIDNVSKQFKYERGKGRYIITLSVLMSLFMLSGCLKNPVPDNPVMTETADVFIEDTTAPVSTIETKKEKQKPELDVMTTAKAEETVIDIKLALYEGKVTNIFFHPPIAYPGLAFDNDSYHKIMDDWFVTVLEFKRIIESLYSDGYVLIKTDEMYETFTTAINSRYLMLSR